MIFLAMVEHRPKIHVPYVAYLARQFSN